MLKANLNKSDEQQTIFNEYKLHILYLRKISLSESGQGIHVDASLDGLNSGYLIY